MKAQSILTSLIVMSLSQVSLASNNVCNTDFGRMYCAEGEIDSIFHLGNTSLSGTHVIGNVRVLGKLEATNAEIGSGNIAGDIDVSKLTVNRNMTVVGGIRSVNSTYQSSVKFTGDLKGRNDVYQNKAELTGDVQVDGSIFKGDVTVIGKLHANASVFNGFATFDSCLIEFNRSTTSQINVKAQHNCGDGEQKIYLKDKSQVKGDIHFEAGNGKVYLSNNSTIIGQVTGGTIVRE